MEKIAPSRVRFGGFELNLQTGELRSQHGDGGNGLILREQPFRVLKLLLERPGKMVSRDEMRKTLWPNDTIVNFDHSINVAIGILRRALSDSADKPRYIETLARRGYRLLVEVEVLQSAALPQLPRLQIAQDLPPRDEIIGKKVSHYRVLEAIGVGGMGVVYSAEDLRLGRRVALKFLPPAVANDETTLLRFEREAQTASTLNHPNICTVYEVEEQDAQPFIVMELLDGVSLSHELDQSVSHSLSATRIIEIALQVCDGLQAAHTKGIIHRDIKPANIFLTTSGPIKILDFGLAKLIDQEDVVGVPALPASIENTEGGRLSGSASKAIHTSITVAGSKIGTASYMSPEQIRGAPLDPATDIFSLGLVLYEAAAGRRAFEGEDATLVHNAILSQTPLAPRRVNPSVPRQLDAVIAKALEKDRKRRYSSALEMRRALEQVRADSTLKPSRRQLSILAASVLALVGTGTALYRRAHPRIVLSPNDTVVLATANETRDPVFDDALYSTLYFGLQQTPYVHVMQTVKLQEAMAEMHIANDAKITPEIGRQVCVRTNSRMVIEASIANEGNNFRIEMKGLDCKSGAILAAVEEGVPSRTQITHEAGQLLAELRGKLGEPPDSVNAYNKPLDIALSASPEALQLLMEGYRGILALDIPAALSDLNRAIAVDPNLAMAYTALAGMEDKIGLHSLAVEAAKKAFTLRDRVTQPVQFQIDNVYYQAATGDQEKNLSVLAKWVQLYPDDFIAHTNYGISLLTVGRLDQALSEARESVRVFPSPWSYDSLAYVYIVTNRFEEAAATIAEAERLNFDNPDLRNQKFILAFLTKNEPGMQEQSSWAVGKPHIDHRFLFAEAMVQGYYGRFADETRLTNSSIEMADKGGDSATTAKYGDLLALDRAEIGDEAVARKLAAKYSIMVQNANTLPILALAFARAGEPAKAQKIMDELDLETPLDTIVQHYYLPTIRASIMICNHDPKGAIDALRSTSPYELAAPESFNGIYPAYIRGLAYLQTGQGHLASLEFQKLIDNPGLTGRDVTAALAHLQVARAETMEGNPAAAQKSYETFFALWKSADASLPIFQQAKIEYAHLHAKA
ncbi:serine/threonine protein kinase [Granulicella aggregans]|uniref:non-specific serine/threonine protein kinase n=1 Tax=Granulicella aggregans TaxID=474949 RepID=A0A7W7ZE28_9BACT|nr:protein kinase [Granulicella aggregans]MBB5058087.1 serine/threonine protein kinase [Granulicella aggregans]